MRGIALPEAEPVEFWIDGDGRLTRSRVPGAATVVDGGWLVPGLVDAHAHLGISEPGRPLDPGLARRHAREHAAAGVAVVRIPGAPSPLPVPVAADPGLPRAIESGRWLALPGHSFQGWARHVTAAELPDAAVAECLASGGWCKIYGDWTVSDETMDGPLFSAKTLAETVRRVRAVGGRVAVHAQREEACRKAVAAGVDSIEHGLWLEPDLLDTMARNGTALVPTLTVWANRLDQVRAMPPGRLRNWLLAGFNRLPKLVAAAHEAGVPVLAGTDLPPGGRIAREIQHLIDAGLSPHAALGAASWAARRFLGLEPTLAEGAPADLVAYPEDPRRNPAVLTRPARVIIRGQVVR
ncbi:amidohydrolase family protein [Carbonactinospora thermoautotrophica]|uniref:amidohydrolase family protein n=1 Tax=Carbonactinospora thermoautotrophica TaxID=1469144 RepID=UPI003DA7AE99